MKISELRYMGRKLLSSRSAQIESYALDTDLLIMHALGIDKNSLLINGEKLVSAEKVMEFQSLLDRRFAKTPIQYIIGKCEFMSLEFFVNESVLIPRPDTETLVEAVLANERSCCGLEIGVGSGCVSISLVHHGEKITMLGTDICEKAVELARRNQKLHNIGPLQFSVNYLYQNVPRGTFFDFIVSNPPYIPTNEINNTHEPRIALDGGEDGLDFFRAIAAGAADHLTADGRIYFEIGHDQGDEVKKILFDNEFFDINILKDLAGRDRVVMGNLRRLSS